MDSRQKTYTAEWKPADDSQSALICELVSRNALALVVWRHFLHFSHPSKIIMKFFADGIQNRPTGKTVASKEVYRRAREAPHGSLEDLWRMYDQAQCIEHAGRQFANHLAHGVLILSQRTVYSNQSSNSPAGRTNVEFE